MQAPHPVLGPHALSTIPTVGVNIKDAALTEQRERLRNHPDRARDLIKATIRTFKILAGGANISSCGAQDKPPVHVPLLAKTPPTSPEWPPSVLRRSLPVLCVHGALSDFPREAPEVSGQRLLSEELLTIFLARQSLLATHSIFVCLRKYSFFTFEG